MNDIPPSWSPVARAGLSRYLYESLMHIIFSKMGTNGADYLNSMHFNTNLFDGLAWLGE